MNSLNMIISGLVGSVLLILKKTLCLTLLIVSSTLQNAEKAIDSQLIRMKQPSSINNKIEVPNSDREADINIADV